MNLQWYFINIAISTIAIYNIHCVEDFSGDACVQAHNILRKKHVDTKDVFKSKDLENAAKKYARRLRGRDTSFPVHPTRTIQRKRRSLDDGINENLHLELWDGDITYPSSNDQWFENLYRSSSVKIGRSIHKFCCSRYEPIVHCPKEFFHDLSFPPSADGVVTDMYNEEERHYDYSTGKSKTVFSHVDHFARIVWRNTTEVGCGQSLPDNLGCVFTVLLYRTEGAVGAEDNFIRNVGHPIVTEEDNPTMKIVVIIFIVALMVGLIVLIYCCRTNIEDRYKSTIMEIDVLKAEQELETDSTNFWWMRPLVRKNEDEENESRSASAYKSIKEKPSIDVVTPLKHRPSLKNIPRHSIDMTGRQASVNNVGQLVNRYRGISMKRQDYMKLTYEDKPAIPPPRPPVSNADAREESGARRHSGKAAPPPPAPSSTTANQVGGVKYPKPGSTPLPKPIPSRPVPPVGRPMIPKEHSLSDSPKLVDKPRPAPRKLPESSSPNNEGRRDPDIPRKPMVPPKRPLPTLSSDHDEERPLSIAERRKLLEASQVTQ